MAAALSERARRDGRKPRSRGTISVYRTAIIVTQRMKGYDFNDKDVELAET